MFDPACCTTPYTRAPPFETNQMRTSTISQLIIFLAMFCGAVSAAERQPNIVIIMADDLGYGDVSCYGATKIDTPNIDRLASEGMKFTAAHAAASVCSPSRYGLVTGRYPWRLHKKGNGYKLEPGRMTIASLVKKKGYQSAAIGKWHLGYGRNWEKPLSPGPLEAGFDYHFGVPTNHNDKYRAFVENHDFVGLEPGATLRIVKGEPFPLGLAEPRVEDQVDTTLTKKAVEFIRRNAERPFLLYFTPCAPHTHVTPAGPFRGTSEAGLYGDHIQELDAHVGEILNALQDLKLVDDTLVIFTSDNGSTPKDFKGTQNVVLNLAEDSHDIRNKFKSAKADAKLLGHVTNGPWQDGKGSPFEGGHRVPFIAKWPGRISAGSASDQSLCLTDILATTADILGARLPADAAEDSISFLPVLLGKKSSDLRKMTFIQGDTKDNAIAVGFGSWKLIASKDSNNEEIHQLYDLSKDPRETQDVAKEHPLVVTKLVSALVKVRSDGRTRPIFVHPGISHSQGSIDFIKSKIAANEQPWKDAWEQLRDSKIASLERKPNPRPHVERGSYNKPDIGSSEFLRDASAAYTHAIQWALTGNDAHAKKSAEIIDAWSRTLETITNHDAKLLIGMGGHKYCNAAELLKHTWDGWPAENQQQFESMLREVWYPVIEDFYPSANGNWDASMLQTMIAMGVVLDDHAMFERAVDYFRNGEGNGAIGNYFNEFGQCQETGRDQAHTQMGLEFLANTCETAWNQKIDLYGELDNRLLKGFEYTAKYNLGFDVPYKPFKSFEGRYNYKSISDNSRGRLRPMYEKVFNHYHNRRGLDAPYTEQAVSKVRPESGRRGSSSSLPWGTLMFAKQPAVFP